MNFRVSWSQTKVNSSAYRCSPLSSPVNKMQNLKTVLLLVIINVGLNNAIPPPSFQNGRIEYTDSSYTQDGPASPENQPSGPYPPSGWTPSGNLLLVPGETHSSQQQGYAPPPLPNNEYGSASESNTEKTTTTTPKDINLDAGDSELNGRIDNARTELGQYYVLLPDGKLQKVQYSGKQKGRGQYEAQVQYEVVDPIRTPVYSYQNYP